MLLSYRRCKQIPKKPHFKSWAGKGVNVNAIAPGYIATDNTEALRNDPVRQEQILARIPAGRWGVDSTAKRKKIFRLTRKYACIN